jgi:hypothetical protein
MRHRMPCLVVQYCLWIVPHIVNTHYIYYIAQWRGQGHDLGLLCPLRISITPPLNSKFPIKNIRVWVPLKGPWPQHSGALYDILAWKKSQRTQRFLHAPTCLIFFWTWFSESKEILLICYGLPQVPIPIEKSVEVC